MHAELTPAAAELIFAVWLFAMGGAVGSFLNVVVYRLPLGKSLVYPGSHCPACEHPIRWHDNVPVLSWFLLRGRCRDCAAKFSFRYPAVEAITAVLFVLVGVIEGLSGGANLPLEPAVAVGGMVLPPLDISQSAGIAAYHLVLLCTLLAAALVEYDGHRLPVWLFLPGLVVGGVAPLVWPYLHPISAWHRPGGPIAGLVDGTAGLGLAVLLGLACRRLPGTKQSLGLVWGPACAGLFLGWQAVLGLTLATVALWWPVSSLGSGRRTTRGLSRFSRRENGTVPLPDPIAWLALLALAWILAWGWLVARWCMLGLFG
ncbi:MAG: prepilin peptidase [Planctomycetota bacterium]